MAKLLMVRSLFAGTEIPPKCRTEWAESTTAAGNRKHVQSSVIEDAQCGKVCRTDPEVMMSRYALTAAAVISAFWASAAGAEPTEIVVRVLAKDAKFIGTETGGAQVTLRDADTGEVLAQGLTSGETGNTPRIMTEGHARRTVLSDDKAAKFNATIDIQRPRRITATAVGPMMLKDQAMTVSSTQWVLPGKPVNAGDGWVLELPGFAIMLMEPLPESVQLNGHAVSIPLKAKVTM